MKNNIDVIMLGDSIIRNPEWSYFLVPLNVLDLGIDGNTTLDILKRVDRVIEINPKIVFLMVGVNDLCLSKPLDEIFENYKKIIELFIKNSINFVVHSIFLTQMPAINKKIIVFNEMLKKYCLDEKIKFLDLFQ